MKQQLDLIVVTEIDHEKMTKSQFTYETELTEAIKEAVKSVLKTPKNCTTVDFEYGDPV